MKNRDSIIRLFNVSKFYGKKYAVKNITMEVSAGELIFITGPSGAGKSTLMKLIYLGEKASKGQIIVNGMNLARITRSRIPYLRRKFGVIFQDFKLIPNRTVYGNVALVLEASGVKPSDVKKRVMDVLAITGMEDKSAAFPPTLSGGEQQRVAVARAVVGNPAIIIADEPTGSLDPDSAQAIFDLLLAYNENGTTILIASHNIQMINNTVKGRSISLLNGSLVSAVDAR